MARALSGSPAATAVGQPVSNHMITPLAAHLSRRHIIRCQVARIGSTQRVSLVRRHLTLQLGWAWNCLMAQHPLLILFEASLALTRGMGYSKTLRKSFCRSPQMVRSSKVFSERVKAFYSGFLAIWSLRVRSRKFLSEMVSGPKGFIIPGSGKLFLFRVFFTGSARPRAWNG